MTDVSIPTTAQGTGSLDVDALGVFQIFTGGGTGSSFLIDDRTLVTNCHVVAPYRAVAVELRDKRRVVGTVRRLQPHRDLAIVEIREPLATQALRGAPLGFEVLQIAGEDVSVKPREVVDIIGFPVGLPLSVTEGVVSHPRQLLDGKIYLQTDAAINPGNSGGPMLDAHKRVVAVTTSKLRSADLVGFGIPAEDVRRFVNDFRAQSAVFGVECPSCEALIDREGRYCDSCGSDLEGLELVSYFGKEVDHPVVAFVERALAGAKIDPVLARHGAQNWSFYSGSAPIKIWCCCSEHLCFSSPLAQPGKKRLDELFRHLLSPEHEPFSFALSGNIIRLNLTIHMSDVFAHGEDDELSAWIARFISTADESDNRLVEEYGCEPAPETQLTFLKEAARR